MSTNKVYGDRPNTIRLRELPTRWDYDDPAFADGIAEDLSIDQSMHSLFGSSRWRRACRSKALLRRRRAAPRRLWLDQQRRQLHGF
jgi:hypothetical protein